MLSRVADSIYWMFRYIERAENTARFVDVNLNLMLDMPLSAQQWSPLIYTTGDDKDFLKRFGEFNKDHVVYFLTFDSENPNSILSCLWRARENARSVREMISSEMWQTLNSFYLDVKAASERPNPERQDLVSFYSHIKSSSHLLAGIMDATVSRSEGYHFGRLGKFLERADKTTRILDVKYFILLPNINDVGKSIDILQWSSVLRSASAFEMFRRTYPRITPANIIDFLVLNDKFPRAIHFCLIQAESSLHDISGAEQRTFSNQAEKKLGLLRSELDFAEVADIFKIGLHEYLDQLQTKLNDVGSAIYQTFFTLEKEKEKSMV